MVALALRFWREIALGVMAVTAALFFGLWQSAREDVGEWREKHRQVVEQNGVFDTRLKEANAKIKAMANEGAASYAKCEALASRDVSSAFDRGVIFGRSTCPR